jgi:hydrogenase-4 component B
MFPPCWPPGRAASFPLSAARRLQSGRLDAYLLYLLIALIAIVAVVTARA